MSQPSGAAVSPFEVINARAGNLQHQTGSKAAEIAIVATIYSLFVSINFYYFARHRWTSKNLKGQRRIDLWSMALVSRHLWQEEVSKSKEESLLGVQTMRNIVMASTLLAMALSQIISRLYEVVAAPENMEQYARYASADPIAGGSFAAPQVILGIALAILILSLASDAEAARLAVHLGFMLRVIPASKGKGLHHPLRQEVALLTQRASLWFTISIRLLFLHFITYSWVFGVTTFLIFGSIMLAMIVWSDYVPTFNHFQGGHHPQTSHMNLLEQDAGQEVTAAGEQNDGSHQHHMTRPTFRPRVTSESHGSTDLNSV